MGLQLPHQASTWCIACLIVPSLEPSVQGRDNPCQHGGPSQLLKGINPAMHCMLWPRQQADLPPGLVGAELIDTPWPQTALRHPSGVWGAAAPATLAPLLSSSNLHDGRLLAGGRKPPLPPSQPGKEPEQPQAQSPSPPALPRIPHPPTPPQCPSPLPSAIDAFLWNWRHQVRCCSASLTISLKPSIWQCNSCWAGSG